MLLNESLARNISGLGWVGNYEGFSMMIEMRNKRLTPVRTGFATVERYRWSTVKV